MFVFRGHPRDKKDEDTECAQRAYQLSKETSICTSDEFQMKINRYINQMHSEQKGKCDCFQPEGFSEDVAFEQGVEGEVRS